MTCRPLPLPSTAVSRSTGREGCVPVGHRRSNNCQPRAPRKSQTKSQRRPTSGDTQRRRAIVKPGQVPTERHRATSSDARNVTGGQGVAGSNPAVPTGSYNFSNIVAPHKSQQKSHLVVQWPFPRPRACHGAPPGMCQDSRARQADQSWGQRSPSHPGSALPPRQLRTGRYHPRHPLTTGRRSPGYRSCETRAGQGTQTKACPRRRRREAARRRAAPRRGRHDRSDLHRHLETSPHPRHGQSAAQVTSQCDVPTTEFSTLKLTTQQMSSRNSCA